MENNNSVCYLAKVKEVKEIKGADNIDLLIVGGWNCVNGKGKYMVGDLVAIATTDAVIPLKMSDAMSVTGYLRSGQRVRTVKLRGVYSECLILPLENTLGLFEGEDLMKRFSIHKHEPIARDIRLSSGKTVKHIGNNNFHVYYKFPNLKNVDGLFNEFDKVEITRKIHGTNARYGIVKKNKISFVDRLMKFIGIADKWVDYTFVYGSHNVEKIDDNNIWKNIADKYNIKNKLWDFVNSLDKDKIGTGIIVYGEIYGAGIQKGYDYGLEDAKFSIFDIKINGDYFAGTSSLVCANYLSVDYVEVLYQGYWSQKIQDSFVFNNYVKGSKVPHEGVVIKHHSGSRDKVAKVINPDYLIYGEKNNIGDSH